MIENLQLVAIVKQASRTSLLRIPLHQDLQNALTQSWNLQYEGFLNGVQRIDFDAGYSPEDHERFCLDAYELPAWLQGENSLTAPDLDAITNDDTLFDSIKGIAGFARTEEGVEIILFQNFSPSHVIRPGKFLFLQNDTYQTIQRPGLTLEGKLSAVYVSNEEVLLFHNFRKVNTFLPLADVYSEASEQQIREVLEHELLQAENVDVIAVNANQWFRKRFATLKKSGVLDTYSVDVIRERSAGYDVAINVHDGKIIFPADKAAAKKLLQFLNEEIFRGPITETLFETNSKREAD